MACPAPAAGLPALGPVRALASRDSAEVTAALLARLTDQDADVRSAAEKTLSESESPQTLLILAAKAMGYHEPRGHRRGGGRTANASPLPSDRVG